MIGVFCEERVGAASGDASGFGKVGVGTPEAGANAGIQRRLGSRGSSPSAAD